MTRTLTAPALDVAAVRADFPILHKPLPNGARLVYLDSGASAQKPRQVLDKLLEVYENYYANAHRGVYYFGVRIDEELEAAREKVQRFLGAAQPEEVIFTAGTTMGVNLVAYGWGRKFLKPGDELVVNVMEHHANLVPWQQLAKEKQARLRYIPLTDDGRLDLSQLDRILNDRTRLVAVSGMSNVLGTINPIDQLAAAAKRVGALVFVDGAQSVPHLPTDVRNPQIDFLAFSGHKFFGPSGVGVLYGRRELLETMDPFLTGGGMIDEVGLEDSTWGEVPARFEAGTLPIAEAIALGAAIDYVTALGFEAIHAHEQRLLEKAHRVLPEIPGLVIYGPAPEHKGSIVSFSVAGIHPHDLAQLLDQKGVACRASHHCTMPLHEHLQVPATTRASFSLYNTEEEVDVLADAIRYARKKFRLS
jgi:cysteine desulfurase/selenocysteine lyase